MDDFLIQLRDDYVINISTNNEYYEGCITCDYGCQYIDTISFYFKNGGCVTIFEINAINGRVISEGFMMKILLRGVEEFRNMSKQEFIDYIHNKMIDHIGADRTRDTSYIKATISVRQIGE